MLYITSIQVYFIINKQQQSYCSCFTVHRIGLVSPASVFIEDCCCNSTRACCVYCHSNVETLKKLSYSSHKFVAVFLILHCLVLCIIHTYNNNISMVRECDIGCYRAKDKSVNCFICGHICHSLCYDLDAAHSLIGLHTNIVFLCDMCIEKKADFAAKPNNNTKTDQTSTNNDNIVQAIVELKGMVVNMQEKIARIERPSFRDVLAGDNPESRLTAKRKRTNNGSINVGNGPETPKGRPKKGIVGNNEGDVGLSSVEARKWIFVSQLHPSTSDESFVDYVKKRLNDADNKLKIQAFALVPKERKREELNFISFKLNIPESSYEAVFQSEIWPKGVVVREFVLDQQRHRRPTGHFLPTSPAGNNRT